MRRAYSLDLASWSRPELPARSGHLQDHCGQRGEVVIALLLRRLAGHVGRVQRKACSGELIVKLLPPSMRFWRIDAI
jgi:hypothetical protein